MDHLKYGLSLKEVTEIRECEEFSVNELAKKYNTTVFVIQLVLNELDKLKEAKDMTNFDLVASFQEKFGLVYDGPPRTLNYEERVLKLMHLEEELTEIRYAETLEEEFDGIIDLVYVALGMAYRMGLPFDEGFRRVHEANLRKVRAASPQDSKRGSQLDIVKPEGWTPADLGDLV